MKPSISRHAAGLLILFLVGCERPFEPIQPRDNFFFSIYGYLDASVDTQWIRVMPFRDVAEATSAPVDVAVKLERLGSGNPISLLDSLFTFPATNIDLGIDRYAWNFGTTEKMEPGATYRVTATRSDGASSNATARLPKDVPDVIVGVSQASGFALFETGFLRLPGAEYLAMVRVNHRRPCANAVPIPRVAYQTLPPMGPGTGNAIEVKIRRDFHANPGIFSGVTPACLLRENRFRWWDIYFVLTGAPWPFSPDWSELESFLEGTATNVTNGAGFLGGVITRTVPFERCYLVGGSSVAPFCELTYNARSASVAGYVMDTACPKEPVAMDSMTVFVWDDGKPDLERAAVIRDFYGATVTLRKPDGTKVRAGYTDRDGSYRIDGLEPGVRYAASVAASVNGSGYQGDEDHFVTQAGQQVRLDLGDGAAEPEVQDVIRRPAGDPQ